MDSLQNFDCIGSTFAEAIDDVDCMLIVLVGWLTFVDARETLRIQN